MEDRKKKVVRKGLLTFADLAGSERTSKTGSEGVRMDESKTINQSISVLGICISQLANRSDHVSYRDSLLTKVLKESLE